MAAAKTESEPHPFDAFTNFMRKLVAIPKAEVDRLREKEKSAKKKRAKKTR